MYEVRRVDGGRLAALLVPLFAALTALLVPATASAADSIYWGNESGAVRVGPLAGSLSGSASDVATAGHPCGVAIDSAAGKIYWANWNEGTIQSADLNGTNANVQTQFTAEPPHAGNLCGVAVDPPNHRIYWGNFSGEIWGADLAIGTGNVTGAAPLVTGEGANGPSGVAVDPTAGKLYWTNQVPGTVRRSDLDGGNVETVIGGQSNPLGVAVAAGKIYWTTYAGGQVRRADLADVPGTVVDLATGQSNPGGVAVDPSAGRIYWANAGGGASIQGANLADLPGGTITTLFSGESASFLPVLLRAPVGAGAPTISGGPEAGKEISCGQGSWAPDLLGAFLYRAPQSFAYQWQRNGWLSTEVTSATFTPIEPGSYACRVTATNQAGSTVQTTALHAIEAPKTRITRKPRAKRARKKANRKRKSQPGWVFGFTDKVPGVSFFCKLDRGPFEPCSSPKVYRHLARGRHRFGVKSRDAAGNESRPQTAYFSGGKKRR